MVVAFSFLRSTTYPLYLPLIPVYAHLFIGHHFLSICTYVNIYLLKIAVKNKQKREGKRKMFDYPEVVLCEEPFCKHITSCSAFKILNTL